MGIIARAGRAEHAGAVQRELGAQGGGDYSEPVAVVQVDGVQASMPRAQDQHGLVRIVDLIEPTPHLLARIEALDLARDERERSTIVTKVRASIARWLARGEHCTLSSWLPSGRRCQLLTLVRYPAATEACNVARVVAVQARRAHLSQGSSVQVKSFVGLALGVNSSYIRLKMPQPGKPGPPRDVGYIAVATGDNVTPYGSAEGFGKDRTLPPGETAGPQRPQRGHRTCTLPALKAVAPEPVRGARLHRQSQHVTSGY